MIEFIGLVQNSFLLDDFIVFLQSPNAAQGLVDFLFS